MVPPSLNSSQWLALYCNADLTGGFRLPPAVGTSGTRYTQAAREQLALISPGSLLEVKIGHIRKSMSILPQTKVPESSSYAFLSSIRGIASSFFESRARAQLPSNTAVFGLCTTNSDCLLLGPRKYCIESVCRECSSATWRTDCPNSPSNMCVAASNYTCSECLADSGCASLSGGVCRSVYPPSAPVAMMPRMLCVACPQVPPTAEILNSTNCTWRCPFGTALNQGGSACIANPVCNANQYLAPSTSDLTFYSSGGINMTNPSCKECSALGVPINTSSSQICFNLVSPLGNLSGLAVGDLNSARNTSSSNNATTCNLFTCKSGYTLNAAKNQCVICDSGSCPLGKYLSGCGGPSPGQCLPCTTMQPSVNMTWIDYRRANITNASNLLACGTICRSGFYRFNQTSCRSCKELEPSLCGPGSILKNCGPGASTGTCTPCTGLGSGMYWTGKDCQQASCATVATTCPPGTSLQGCGGTSPGTCVACPLNKPTTAIAWKPSGCNFTCNIGSFVNATSNACINCNTLTCPLGKFLSGCGVDGVSPGKCAACQQLGMGLYFSQPNSCNPTHCDSTICSLSQKLNGCGYGVPGSCVDCGPVPQGIHFFTRLLRIGGANDCSPGCNPGYEIVDDSASPLGVTCQLIPTIDLTYGDDYFS